MIFLTENGAEKAKNWTETDKKYHKIQKTDAEPTRNGIGTDSENGTDPGTGNDPGTPTRPGTIRITAMNTGTHLIN